MEFRQLECFVRTADFGSTCRAAESLHTSQSSVSKHITALERELEITLFVRTNRGVRLTPDGHELYDHARRILQNARMMQTMSGKKRHQKFRIACYASAMISRLFCDYYMTLPQGEYKGIFLEGTVEEIIDYVHNDITEIGIVFLPENKHKYFERLLAGKNLDFVEISRHDLCIYASEKSSLYNKSIVHFSELENIRFIQRVDGFFSVENNLGGYGQDLFADVQINKVITTNSDNQLIETILNTDLCNIGIRLINSNYRKYAIKDIPIAGCSGCLSLGYIRRNKSTMSPEVGSFLKRIVENLCAVQHGQRRGHKHNQHSFL
ncbi:LysR family transcriptional regulator [Desulfovibrio intestinalis]|uniref:DNA-binding transcriptional LysR family regulator n=1 Tax=Desulfovibrio intestinalis TaxID=58621 RepID=A0A7W8BYQ8_9BACT|nr:LysR family transcriptional regulator [Desulfovibrio intestinalis]MBB5142421.1 DNA-binding transcriptional LysR family regulator [Desulfovibrio intestinalis]